MSKIVKYIAITFERGIIENFKQEALNNDGVTQSVLWLNNWNPNIESKSLVRRYIETIDNPLTWSVVLGDKQYSISLMNSSQPEAFKMPFVIVQANSKVKIYAKCFRYTAGGVYSHSSEYSWFNSIDTYSSSPYRGYMPVGEFMDYFRYGEALYFVNKVAYPSSEKVYPVYKFAYWDKTKIRGNGNVWFNGINNIPSAGIEFDVNNHLPYGVFSMYKVFEPNRDLISKFAVVFSRKTLTQDERVGGDTTNTLNGLITLHLWENIGEYGDDKIFHKLHSYAITPEIPNNTYIESHIEAMWDNFKPTIGMSFSANEDGKLVAIPWELPAFNVHHYDDTKHETYKDLLGDYSNIKKNVFSDSKNSTFKCLLPSCSKFSPNPLGPDIENSYYEMDWDFKQSKKPVTFALPNYISNKMPRNWFPGEKIDLLVTVVENGIETILGTYSHIVTEDGYQFASSTNQDTTTFLFDQHVLIPMTTTEHIFITESNFSNKKWTFSNGDTGTWYIGGGLTTDAAEGLHYIKPEDLTYSRSKYANYPFTHNRPKYVCFDLTIGYEALPQLLTHNVSAIKVYVVQPDTSRDGILSSITSQAIKPPATLYSKPKDIQLTSQGEHNYSVYSLIKEFRIVGDGNKIESWEEYDRRYNVTNSWIKDDTRRLIWASGTITNSYEAAMLYPTNGRTCNYDNINGITIEFEEQLGGTVTPDFCIWDYPSDSPVLNLGFSGKIWKGLGAELIVISNGVVYIGGCHDEYGNIEPGVWRWCLIQNGIPAHDIFPDENKITFGQENHTAGVIYREQLIAFTRDEFYRMNVAQAYTPEQWEVLDAVYGHGTFGKKTVCVCPDGFVFCDSSGIWISDGRLPMSLTDSPEKGLAITSLYQSIILGITYPYTALNNTFVLPTGAIQDGYNIYAELLYDELNNELILTSPVILNERETSLNLIYSFTFNNWRIETFDREGYDSYSIYHRYHFAKPNHQMALIHIDSQSGNKVLEFTKQDVSLNGVVDTSTDSDILCSIKTHQLGDDIDDNIMHSTFLAVEPDTVIPDYQTFNDPKLIISYRSNNNILGGVENTQEIVSINMQAKMSPTALKSAYNQLQTPIDNSFGDDRIVSNESMKMLFPMRSKFRRATIEYLSKYTVKIKTLVLKVVSMKRRQQ